MGASQQTSDSRRHVQASLGGVPHIHASYGASRGRFATRTLPLAVATRLTAPHSGMRPHARVAVASTCAFWASALSSSPARPRTGFVSRANHAARTIATKPCATASISASMAINVCYLLPPCSHPALAVALRLLLALGALDRAPLFDATQDAGFACAGDVLCSRFEPWAPYGREWHVALLACTLQGQGRGTRL